MSQSLLFFVCFDFTVCPQPSVVEGSLKFLMGVFVYALFFSFLFPLSSLMFMHPIGTEA